MVAAKGLILLLLLVATTEILSKPTPYSPEDDLDKLYDDIENLRENLYNILNESGKNLVEYSDKLLTDNINILYATSTTELLDIKQYVDKAEKFDVDIESCDVAQTEDKLRSMPTEVTDDLTICVELSLTKLQPIIYNTFAKVQMFEDTVNDIADELKSCNNDDCLNKVTKEIEDKVNAFNKEGEDITNGVKTSINDIKNNIDECSDSIVKEAVMTMAGMTSDVVHCIVETLAENGH